jgi:hypothetical protein
VSSGSAYVVWRAARPVAATLTCALLTGLGTSASTAAPTPAPAPAQPGARVWGVTLDDVTHSDALSRSLSGLPERATARVVFDPGLGPASYAPAVHRIQRAAEVLGQPVDSSETASYTRAAYRSRFARYVAAFPRAVDVWEVGNEVNGEWTGRPRDVVAKTLAAYRIAHRAGKQTALTLYFNPGCADDRAHRMLTWVRRQLPAGLLNGPTYVLVSYYPSACGGYWPSPAHWQRVFDRLHRLFPHSALGFGEAGTTRRSLSQARRAALLHRYDEVDVRGDRFVGGGFWWTFAEDARSRHTPVWQALAADMRVLSRQSSK